MVETQAQSSVSSVVSVHTELFLPVSMLSSLFLFYFIAFIVQMDCTVSVQDLVCLPDSSKSEQCVYTVICVCVSYPGSGVCARTKIQTHRLGQKTALHPPADQQPVNEEECCVLYKSLYLLGSLSLNLPALSQQLTSVSHTHALCVGLGHLVPLRLYHLS